ncbi:LysR family transcriptional regulator [Variovorax fucosicus]|uniref:LysR family transcriptional regulator n=1 Tax=Variovorax fucosicus TaxID=3053517 RepID=UPI00257854CE|nr:LysR family transcriptional regulator [Variovorax sp. J22G47]MDM0056807.1 LysR family transcriptional regulator [Variovorax sp. J22G47]
MSSTIDPTTLRVFIAVCEEGTILRAAEREFIAASAVSKRIADVEAAVGTPLLHRSQRGVHPTAAGATLLAQGRVILRSLAKLKAELGEYAQGVRGHVHVLANVSSIVEFLPEQLIDFLAAHPDIRLDVEERTSANILRGIAEGVADIGVCRNVGEMEGVECTMIGVDHFAAVVPEAHPLAQSKSLAFTDTLEYDHVGLSLNTTASSIMQRVAAAAGSEIRYRIHVSSIDAALRLVHSGLAICVMTQEIVARYRSIYRLRAVPLTDVWATQEFSLCIRSDPALSPAARLLFDHLRAQKSG